MPLLPELSQGWDDVADLIADNCTITVQIPNGTVTYDPETGNSIFAQRSISIRAHVRETNEAVNRAPRNSTIGVDDSAKVMIGRVFSVTDSANPSINQRRLPETVMDLTKCRLEFDSPTGFKRTGSGIIRLAQTDIYNVHASIGERFYIRFVPDKLRVS